ncbi:MAG: hypothetical protein Q8Q14_10910 [Gemmatimonadales bacterium]|nr:hypothetical protein [Gemmatimonadales bacterium]
MDSTSDRTEGILSRLAQSAERIAAAYERVAVASAGAFAAAQRANAAVEAARRAEVEALVSYRARRRALEPEIVTAPPPPGPQPELGP